MERSHRNSQITQAVARTTGALLSTTPLLKTPTQLTEHGEVELVSTESLHLYLLVSLVQEGTLYIAKGEM